MSALTHLPISLLLALTGVALTQTTASEAKITITSPAFSPGGKVPEQFSCKGANVNPSLQFGGIPAGAKSLVLIMDDPDAPGGLFTHWLVWNIDPTASRIGEKSMPAGASQGANDFGNFGYGGPCPPSATHRYFFRLFALDQKLDLQGGAKRKALENALAGHILARGELMGRFSH